MAECPLLFFAFSLPLLHVPYDALVGYNSLWSDGILAMSAFSPAQWGVDVAGCVPSATPRQLGRCSGGPVPCALFPATFEGSSAWGPQQRWLRQKRARGEKGERGGGARSSRGRVDKVGGVRFGGRRQGIYEKTYYVGGGDGDGSASGFSTPVGPTHHCWSRDHPAKERPTSEKPRTTNSLRGYTWADTRPPPAVTIGNGVGDEQLGGAAAAGRRPSKSGRLRP